MSKTPPLSVLDLVPVGSGISPRDALCHSLDLARRADRLGYTRYWFAEHHNMPGIASSAPEILIGQAARETERLRIGSGGIMLPNHAPLKVAEVFLTLENLFPGRIDLGIGRAPGSDPITARALRRPARHESGGTEDLDRQLDDLYAFAGDGFPDDHPYRRVSAVPQAPSLPPVWLLGSSDYGARLAAARGLGFVFARHINPEDAEAAMRLYRETFVPSVHRGSPYAILAVSVLCAETDEEADRLAAASDLAFLLLRQGRPGPIPSPAEARAYPYSPFEEELVLAGRGRLLLGTPSRVRERLLFLAEETRADELMITTITHGHAERVRSYELLAEAFDLS
ncbi:MAG: LLM class flavin-dependent oxidoreductase [Capsulimonadales bacterium]|nr:LLM class flavin-dependent oxidoreductase [Capsulimonadales bacterium]